MNDFRGSSEREIIAMINSHHLGSTYDLDLGFSPDPLLTICMTVNKSFKLGQYDLRLYCVREVLLLLFY